MEADWSVEIGADLPLIVVPWSGEGFSFVDLSGPSDAGKHAAALLPETQRYPALGRALQALNARGSGVFTSKCDAWPLEADEIDPLEFDAQGPVCAGLACYIDIVHRDEMQFASFLRQEDWLRRITTRLSGFSLRSARVELVLRQAEVFGRNGFGVTVYGMGCGEDPASAAASWAAALVASVQAICSAADGSNATMS